MSCSSRRLRARALSDSETVTRVADGTGVMQPQSELATMANVAADLDHVVASATNAASTVMAAPAFSMFATTRPYLPVEES